MKRRDFLKLTSDQRRQFLAREIVGKKLYRQLPTIKRENINEEERTIDLSIATDAPYDRWYYTEILSHEKGAVRLGRLNDGGAFCSDHDTRRQIGAFVPGTVRIEDHKTRGLVKFSERKSADDEWKDVLAGIRTKTSVGYIIHKYEYDEKTDTLTATDWEPLEGSLVAVPADTDTGTDRELSLRADDQPACDNPECEDEECDGSCTDDEESKSRSTPKKPTHPAQTPRSKATAPSKVGRRQKLRTNMALKSLKRKLRTQNCPEGSEPCDNERCETHYQDESPDERSTAPEQSREERFAAIAKAASLGDEEGRRFALIASNRALGNEGDEADLKKALLDDRKARAKASSPDQEDPQAVASRNGGGAARITSRVRLKNFKNHEEAHRFGQFLGAVLRFDECRAFCRENGIALRRDGKRLSRAQSENDNASGGIWVPEEFSDTLVVLREQFGLVRQFGDVETMTSATKNVRRQRQGLTAYPAGAKGSSRKVAESEMDWDFFELVARKWKVTTKIEDELTEDAIISIADKFAGESAYAHAYAEDNAFFNADGSSTYHGVVGLKTKLRGVDATIANIKGLVVASGNLFSEFVLGDFIKVIAALPQYADNANTAWYMHRSFFWNTVVPLLIAAGGTTESDIANAPELKLRGYPVRISQVLPSSDANSQIACYFGDISKSSTFGDRLGQTVKQTDTNDDDWDNDLISMKCTTRWDVNHHDVGDTVKAGPVIGLISAAS